MNIALVVPVMKSGEKGGAEALYQGLVQGFRKTPHDVDRIDVVVDESSFDAILESYEKCSNLDLHDYDLVLSTKAPTYAVRHRNHVSYLLHTIRVFYDMFHQEFGRGTLEQFHQRRQIHTLDKQYLASDRIRKHFVNGHIPYRRLYDTDAFWQQIRFEVLHHPPVLQGFREPRAGEYIFMPSRLHRWKRVDLVIQAFQHVEADIPLKIAGSGEDEAHLRKLAAGDRRIEFLGRVSDEELLELYAGALAIPFVPLNEDYGLITIEAFRSKKPVITCTDSGEPLYFVKDTETGFVVRPEPEAVAARLNYLIDHPDLAIEMGEKGFASVSHITWDAVISRILSSIELPQKRVQRWTKSPAIKRPLNVLITDNQCIEPAVGGGRLRLLGLYSTLVEGIEATYVGTYDWSGPEYRELQLSARLREIDIPQSQEHFALNNHLNALLPGKTIIDVTIPWLIWSSHELVDAVRQHAAQADVIILSHPWMYGCLRDLLRQGGKLIIYDAQNCEAVLREKLLGSNGFGRCLAQSVKGIEGQLCHDCDLILACSEEDKQSFVEVYGVTPQKITIVPNGVDVRAISPAATTVRAQAREKLSITGFVALFIGSAYPPNIEASQIILEELAPANPDVTFVIVGGAGPDTMAQRQSVTLPPNVRILGTVSDEVRNQAYAAANIAINPMMTGFGTNIKMLDYLAAGLPTITTPVGARGLNNRDGDCFIVDDISQFSEWIQRLQTRPELYGRLASNARKLAEEVYDWQHISQRLGQLLLARSLTNKSPSDSPYFSVVIPSYERAESLGKLLELLSRQVCVDFEVIVVDQSAVPFNLENVQCHFPIQYIHTTEKGAVKARNLGIKHACGQVIAFTDDDCEPDAQWLANARKYFNDARVVGVEGLIESDSTDEERYRIVTNRGVKGIGFMTANLFFRKDIVEKVGGFDERFDNPHFREDTDLAWRALAAGEIIFASDVKILHPSHPRDIQRESREQRAKFFVNDPLLFQKHPEKYVQLLKAERHAGRAGFWEHFMRGMVKHRLDLPIENLRELTTDAQYALLSELSKLLGAVSLERSGLAGGSIAGKSNAGMLPETIRQDARASLTQYLQVVLESYNHLEYGRQLNPVDAFFAFRLLLGRNPDLVRELPQILSDTRTTREFLNDLLNSAEFSHCVGFVPPNRVLMAKLEDFRLWFNTSDAEMGMRMASGQYEPHSIALIKDIVRPGMKCIDAGAHIGFYTCLVASLVGASGKVYAFEPMPSNFELLLKNIEENQFQRIVQAQQRACSDASQNLSVSKISNMFVVGQVSGAERVTTEAVRLDDVIKDAIDLVKLDVEGYEPAVVRGMMSLIARDKPVILSEINEYWLQSCSHSSAREYVGLLESLGYEVFDVQNLQQPITESHLTLDILDTVDVVAFPRGHVR